MKIERKKPIIEFITRYCNDGIKKVIVDLFGNENSIKEHLSKECEYISNDLDLEATEFMQKKERSSVDVVLYNSPYSGMRDNNYGNFVKVKKEISRILKPNGICITCCWDTNEIGKKFGMELEEILIVTHSSNHNNTFVVVERKI